MGHLIQTLDGYGTIPCLCGLLATFWYHQKVVPWQNGYHMRAFPDTWGTMQDGLVSLTLFNIVMENVIRTWLAMMVEDQRVAHGGMDEAVGRRLGVFYANDGMVGSRDSNWLQHSMNVLIGIFWWCGLADNVAKSRTRIYQPGTLRLGMLEDDKELKCMEVGASHHDKLRRRIPSPECGIELTAGLMRANHCQMNRTEPAIDWNRLPVSQTDHHTQVYNVSFLRTTNRRP